jgi:fatty-acyl-CoA synthase
MGMSSTKAIWTLEEQGIELAEKTIGEMLDLRAQTHGNAEALVFRAPETGIDRAWTYKQLRDDAVLYARALIGLGIVKGDKVAVLSPNCPDWIILEYALAKIGAVLVTVNPAYRDTELRYLLENGDVHTLFFCSAFRGFSVAGMIASLVPEAAKAAPGQPLHAEAFPMLRHLVCMDGDCAGALGMSEFRALASETPASEVEKHQAHVEPNDLAQIQYTSGTTGAPKGVMLSHRSTLNNAIMTVARGGFSDQDRILSPMPLFHTAGCVCNVLGCLAAGAPLIAMPAFDARRALELMESERATILNGAPTMFIRMMDVMDEDAKTGKTYDLSSFRLCWTGGTTILPSLMEEVKRRMGADPMVIFGMTETSPLVTMTNPGDSFELCAGTAGQPLAHTEIRIYDHDRKCVADIGQQGELQIRGYLLMLGYYKMPERTAETIVDGGWLRSGDLATLDATGYLRITGRLKDMIIRGGENIYPAEVENQLQQHPKIAQAQLVAVPDREMGEECCAFIELKPGETADAAEIAQWCRAHMARHKLPKYIEFVDAFPLTPSGKIKKYELRELAAQRIGISA